MHQTSYRSTDAMHVTEMYLKDQNGKGDARSRLVPKEVLSDRPNQTHGQGNVGNKTSSSLSFVPCRKTTNGTLILRLMSHESYLIS